VLSAYSLEEIINKVAGSGLVTIDLQEFVIPGERVVFDLKPHLFHGQILKEKEFRDFIKSNDWSAFKEKIVGLTCTAEAIVPTWAYMLLAIALQPYASRILYGDSEQLDDLLFAETLAALDISQYKDKRVVIKGCADQRVPLSAYVQITAKLLPVVKSIMYGEPCSTVPLYKQSSKNKD
jgi:hypothetical protein